MIRSSDYLGRGNLPSLNLIGSSVQDLSQSLMEVVLASGMSNGWLVMKQVGINKYGGLIMKQRETILRSVVMDYESEKGGAEAS